MKIGIVGLPNVGKSTLFNAITKAGAESSNYPFCTIEPNVGIAIVKDKRIDELSRLNNSKKKIYPTVEFIDIAGLVKGASKGEGLGNKFLSHIREVDAIIHVVRAFDDENITHVNKGSTPKDDIEIINLELILKDIETVNKNIEKVNKLKKTDKSQEKNFEILSELLKTLESEKALRTIFDNLSEEQIEYVNSLNLLTTKKIIYVANVSEDDVTNDDNEKTKMIREFAEADNAALIKISAKIESEIASLSEEETEEFLKELGITESGLEKLVHEAYKILGLITYLTSGEPETRGWTINEGDKAPKAAGKIHTDFEKGFIRAEVISYEELVKVGSFKNAKEQGKLRVEGKDYVVKDGDVLNFLFNV